MSRHQMLIIDARLTELRHAYVALVAGQRKAWINFHDHVQRLLDVTRDVADNLPLKTVRQVCRHAETAVEVFRQRPSAPRGQLQEEITHLTKTLIEIRQ
jgi:hypothetical protein